MTSNNKLVKLFVGLILFPFVLGSLHAYFVDHNIYKISFVDKTTFAFYMYLIAFLGSIYILKIKKEERYKNWWNLISIAGIFIFGLLAFFVSEFSRFGF